MKKYFGFCLLFIMLICTACSDDHNPQIQSEPETILITIPESYFRFTRADIEEQVESYKKYCTNVKIEDADLVLEVTEKQRNNLVDMNDEYIEKTVEEFKAVDSNYNCELSPDYSSVVYEYDEKLYEYDREENGRIQAGILMGVTSTHVLNGILENNNPDWEIQLVVKNCYNGNVVAETVLPEGGFTIRNEDWEASYKE